MIQATELKAGTTFQLDGKPYKVVKYTHTKLGRGGANVVVSIKNLETGDLGERTFKSGHKVEEIITSKKSLQYLYSDAKNAVFMDPMNFEQVDIPKQVVGDDLVYVKEGGNCDILFWSPSADSGQASVDIPLNIEIPPKVALKVIETVPGVKGNTASNAYKPAKLENGIEVKIPLFINQGETIIVDSRTGEYVERAK